MKIFNKKKTPIKSIDVIKKWVGKLDFTVKNFNNGLATMTVKVRTNNVATKYVEIVGNTIPLLNNPMTKKRTKKYTNNDFINCFIIRQSIY